MATEPTGYIGLAVESDADEIAQAAFDYVTSKLPGWEPAEANIETILIETQAQEQAVERDLASQTADDIFRSFGQLVGITPIEATPARGTTTWTMADNAGYTVPAGTQVMLTGLDGGQVGFQTLADFTVPNGQTVATGVTVEAIEPGSEGTGLSGTAELADAIDALVASVVVVGVTTGGLDAEQNSAYLARLAVRLQLQATSAILPRDFEVLARDVSGVARAMALDGYNPADSTFNNERMVAVAVVDEAGQPLPAPTKATVDTLLQAQREVNFVVNVIDPSFTAIDVVATVKAQTGYDATYVDQAATDAISAYLSPANWGRPPVSEEVGWINRTVVRASELVSEFDRADGVDYVVSLAVGKQRNCTIAAATNLVTLTAHGYLANDPVVFRSLTGGAGLVVGTTYFVRDVLANTFAVSATPGGAAIDVTTDATAATVVRFGGERACTIEADDNLVTLVAHGLKQNDPVRFRALTGGAGLTAGTTYFARDVTVNTFAVAATPGGAVIDVTTDATAATIEHPDITLTGAAPLTTAGTIAITAEAP